MVVSGTPPLPTAVPSACSASIAPGTTNAGLSIRTGMVAPLGRADPDVCTDDTARTGDVTHPRCVADSRAPDPANCPQKPRLDAIPTSWYGYPHAERNPQLQPRRP